MARQRTEMDRVQELVRLHRLGTGRREVARLLGMSPNTERQYREILSEAGLLAGAIDVLPEPSELRAAIEQRLPAKRAPQQTSSVEPWLAHVEEMVARGAKPKAIFDCLRLEVEGFSGSLSAIKRLWRRLREAKPIAPEDVVIPTLCEPGEIAQVDFGYVGKLYDPERGVLRKAWVFVMVLSFSRHMFARVVFDQRSETWLRLHALAFAQFGGAVATVVPDNLKSAVVRAAFGLSDEVGLNRSYRELARHFGFKVDPTPPRSPEKKGGVESGVKYVKHNFFGPREFADVNDANTRLARWVLDIAGQRIHGTTGTPPLALFESTEKACLRPLPATPFDPTLWQRARVHRDSRIVFERYLYPVPYRLIGRDVWIQASTTTVAIYSHDERVATHQRGKPVPPEVYDQYLPPERRSLRYRSETFWLERAAVLGPGVLDYVREVFAQDDVLSQLRQVQAIVNLLARYPPERAQRACERAHFYGNYTYRGVRDILDKALDLEPLPHPDAPAPAAAARPRYARDVRELLQLPLMEQPRESL